MNRIKELRLAAGLKQAELAQMIGVRQNTLSTWETGRHEPDIESLTMMARVFGTSVDEVIGNDGEDAGGSVKSSAESIQKTEQAAAPKGNGLSEEVARLFAELEPEDQVEVIAKICELRGRVKEK